MGAVACTAADPMHTWEKSCGRDSGLGGCAPPCGDNAPSLAWGEKAVQELRLLRASTDGDVNAILGLLKAGTYVDTRKRPTMRPRAEVLDEDAMLGIRGEEGCSGSESAPKEVFELDGTGKLQRCKEGLRGIGLTPLMCASQEGHIKAVRALLSFKASPHMLDDDGMSPLHFAATAGCTESCTALLLAKANPEVQDDEGRDAFACLPKQAIFSRVERRSWENLLRTGKLPPGSGAPELSPSAAACGGGRERDLDEAPPP